MNNYSHNLTFAVAPTFVRAEQLVFFCFFKAISSLRLTRNQFDRDLYYYLVFPHFGQIFCFFSKWFDERRNSSSTTFTSFINCSAFKCRVCVWVAFTSTCAIELWLNSRQSSLSNRHVRRKIFIKFTLSDDDDSPFVFRLFSLRPRFHCISLYGRRHHFLMIIISPLYHNLNFEIVCIEMY